VLQDHVLNGSVIDLKKVNPIVRRRRRKVVKNMNPMAAKDLDQIVRIKKMDTMAANDLDHHVQKKMDLGKHV